MELIKKLEEGIKLWKASRDNPKSNDKVTFEQKDGFVKGLELALEFAKEPSNTQMHMDKDPCEHCRTIPTGWELDGYKLCPHCGRGLSQ